jgi:hypothetical protein
VRGAGDGVEPVAAGSHATVDEIGRRFGLGIDDHEPTSEAASRERVLRIRRSFRSEREREIEYAVGLTRYDQTQHDVGRIGEAGQVPAGDMAEDRSCLGIARQRAGKVDDDLVIGAPAVVRDSPADEHAWHGGVEDAKVGSLAA